jgi:hypothetical protein
MEYSLLVQKASSRIFQTDIESKFPRLTGIRYELMKSSGSGSVLVPLIQEQDIPSLAQFDSLRLDVIYIRPFVPLEVSIKKQI